MFSSIQNGRWASWLFFERFGTKQWRERFKSGRIIVIYLNLNWNKTNIHYLILIQNFLKWLKCFLFADRLTLFGFLIFNPDQPLGSIFWSTTNRNNDPCTRPYSMVSTKIFLMRVSLYSIAGFRPEDGGVVLLFLLI